MIHKFTKLALCSAATLLVAGQAFAHTGVRDTVTVSNAKGAKSVASYNGFTITHGCGGDTGNAYPVIGQGAVFPTGDKVAWREWKADSTGTLVAGDVFKRGGGAGIFDTIVLDHTGTPLPDAGLNLQVTGYSGMSSSFATAHELVDPDALNPGVVEGLLWKDGAMEPKLNTITPFKVTVPKIIDSNIKQVKIRIGVINYCDLKKNAANDASGPYKQPKDAFGRAIPILATSAEPDQINPAVANIYNTLVGGNGDNNRQDWWFGGLDGVSALYNDPDLLQPTEAVRVDHDGNPVLDSTGQPIKDPVTPYWTTLTVNNATAKKNATRVVSIEPTGEAFDAILTGANTQPFTKGKANF